MMRNYLCIPHTALLSLLRYINDDRVTLNFDGMAEDLERAPSGSVILLHACAHNPTGSWSTLYPM